jgi:pseudouridine kinase
LARLGCRVSLFSVVGEDQAGDALLGGLESDGVNISSVTRSVVHSTANYTAVLETDGSLFIGLADMDIFEEANEAWADGIAERLAQCTFWVIDANLPAATIARLLKRHKGGATALGDPISIVKAARFREVLDAIDVIFPNMKEASVLSGLKVERPEDVPQAAGELRHRGVKTVVVTLGADGLYVEGDSGGRFVLAIPPKHVRDVTGAGDALVAGYAYGLARDGKYGAELYGLAAASLTLETEESTTDLNVEKLVKRIESRVEPRTSRS